MANDSRPPVNAQSGEASSRVAATRPAAAKERAEPHAVVLWKQGFSAPSQLVRYVVKVAARTARRAMIIIGAALVVILIAIAALTIMVMSGHAPDLALVLQSVGR